MPAAKDVLSAGVVAFRPGKKVLLVHRPKYDDWSFPKGKLDRGEHAVSAAVREVAEETGLHVRLGPPISDQRYPVGPRMKTVHYWTGRPVGDDDVSCYRPNREIDGVAWVSHEEAMERLTYPRDRETLSEALRARQKTVALVVLRHAHSRSRKAWRADDRERPLLQTGHLQAQRLVPLLAAYDVRRVVTSSSVRCLQTVVPYADTAGLDVEQTDRLTEEGATEKKARRVVEAAVACERGTVLCSHRIVLPMLFDALGLVDPELEKGEMLVAHLRKGRVVSTERHRVP
ncbi:MAG: NUDIX hydrolase [Actinomycetota bacterium]|nr:NUDIX hydrolase [Actinomycetota bacterium]